MSACCNCGATLSFNEIGAHKKLISRASTSFLCKACLAKKLQISPALIDEKIEQFIKQGCTLFI